MNVLIALFDPAHIHHEAAHEWFGSARASGWATSPTTQTGFVRIVSNPAYVGNRTTVSIAAERLRALTEAGDHVFWPDAVSLVGSDAIDLTVIGGHRQITDAYLLALAVANRGVLATFDRRLPVAAVTGAGDEHLMKLA